ncbi:hypothetical protein PbDSM24746_45570 [Paenibacillus macerans]|nr:hypothetical protein PbDSM24746_45570 [Paenibacillus macerans]
MLYKIASEQSAFSSKNASGRSPGAPWLLAGDFNVTDALVAAELKVLRQFNGKAAAKDPTRAEEITI